MSVNFEPEMIVIPAGEFLMGCATGAANERPEHRVWVDRFAVGRYAVTNLTALTPIDDHTTEVNHCVYWNAPWLSALKPALRP